VRACAAIVREGRLLLVVGDEPGIGVHYNLPGGGVHYGEAITDEVRREAREETGFEVEVGRLLLTYEALHEDDLVPGTLYQSYGWVFECSVANGTQAGPPTELDSYQTGVKWMTLDELPRIFLLPHVGAEVAAALRGDPDAPRFCRHTLAALQLRERLSPGCDGAD